jgi:uncharacterized caspase-like protein/tetratricopeptide (TPR) repeat protein
MRLILFKLIVVAMIALSTSPAIAQQQEQQQRDLRLERIHTPENPGAAAGRPSIPRGYAVVIGVGQYKNLNARQQLQFADRDAEAIYSVLISPEGGNFRAENVHKLTGSKATLQAIRTELEEWLPSVALQEDRVFVYFAGHGFVKEGKPYLAPSDFDPANTATTGYSMNALGSALKNKIKARWKVLLTDACHSGAINPDVDVMMINQSLMDLDQSLFSLTASRDRERSFESADWGGGHGIFTYYVVRGLEGAADETADGIVTADELAEYVRRNVREATRGLQNPTSERASFDPRMLLAYVPANRTPDAPPPPKFGTFVFEANTDGVEVFVDGKSVAVVDKGKPFRLPGLQPGIHLVKAVKLGYEPDGPREEIVYPGAESTVTLRILVARRRNKQAVELFEDGLESYIKGGEENYRRAERLFVKALDTDAAYSEAALYLARTYNALFDQTKAKRYFQKSIEIDPDYAEARASFAGMLLDIGDTDLAIRQLTAVIQRYPRHTQAQYLLAEAFRMKGAYNESIESARHAIEVSPENAEARFWLAESLRLKASSPINPSQIREAKTQYLEYLRLSDFDSKLAGKMNYYVVGFLVGKGKKKRAAQHDIWEDLRSLAYFGLCDCDRLLSNYRDAIAYCQKSLAYDKQDPYSHYALALALEHEAQAAGSTETLAAALTHFKTVLEINADIAEAANARKNISLIQELLFGQ